MSEYKYPYIADKKMYAAVMNACKYIRETGYFNKAVSYNAQRFGVDPDELAKEIRKRQSAGQKAKSKTEKRKYKYFIVLSIVESCEGSERYVDKAFVAKGLSKDSVDKKYIDLDFRRTRAADTGSYYSPCYLHETIKEFDTKEEADSYLQTHIKDIERDNEWSTMKMVKSMLRNAFATDAPSE